VDTRKDTGKEGLVERLLQDLARYVSILCVKCRGW